MQIPRKLTLAEALYSDIESNESVNQVYDALLYNYSREILRLDIPYKEFDELVNSDRFVPSEQRRYKNQAVFTMLSRFIPDSAAST